MVNVDKNAVIDTAQNSFTKQTSSTQSIIKKKNKQINFDQVVTKCINFHARKYQIRLSIQKKLHPALFGLQYMGSHIIWKNKLFIHWRGKMFVTEQCILFIKGVWSEGYLSLITKEIILKSWIPEIKWLYMYFSKNTNTTKGNCFRTKIYASP